MKTVLVAVLLVAGVLGCTADAPAPPAPAGPAQPPAGGAGDTAPLSVTEALERGGTVTVRGGLIATDGVVRMCDVTNDSYPPRCVEPFLQVQGVDVGNHSSTEVDGVRFTHGLLTLTGRIRRGVLTVDTVEDG